MRETTYTVLPKGPFDLDVAERCLGSLTPSAREYKTDVGHVHLAVLAPSDEAAVGVCVRQPRGADGEVEIEIVDVSAYDGDPDAGEIVAQVARMFSLDVDGRRYLEIGQRDRIAGELQQRYPGLRPVCFSSPFEAGAWALISNRLRTPQAAHIKAGLSRVCGPTVTVHGETMHAFPGPSVLVRLRQFDGLSDWKVRCLRVLSEAALEGALDATRLRSEGFSRARDQLEKLPGIGGWSSALILDRGAGEPDHALLDEPQVLDKMRQLYGGDASTEELCSIAEGWSPYRTWVTALLRVAASEDSGQLSVVSNQYSFQ
jgi:DNA-3-methyladenine glycosylase II